MNKQPNKTETFIDDYFIFNPLLINIMRNDILMTNWINTIYKNFMDTKNLNLDTFILTIPKKYVLIIKQFSFNYNISKVNLIPTLIYNVTKINRNMYKDEFINHISILHKINSSVIQFHYSPKN